MNNESCEVLTKPLAIPQFQGDFLGMFTPLRELPKVFIPCDLSILSFTKPSQYRLMTALDSVYWPIDGAGSCGVILTSELFKPDRAFLLSVKPEVALERYFHSPQQLWGVVFNPPSEVPHFSWTALRFSIPRIIGLLRTKEPFLSTAEAHAQCARREMENDQVFTSLFHASMAREAALPLSEFFTIELEALLSMGLWTEAAEFIEWYRERGGNDPEVKILEARLHSYRGDSQRALAVITGIEAASRLRAGLTLELGRILFNQKKYSEALKQLEIAISLSPRTVDIQYSYGTTMLTLGKQRKDFKLVREAIPHLREVTSYKGYHLAPALYQIGLAYLELGKFHHAEKYLKKSLRIRFFHRTRGALIEALVGQKKESEAELEATVCDLLDPNQPSHQLLNCSPRYIT